MNKVSEKPGARILHWLDDSCGLSPSEVQHIGALIVSGAYFEGHLERAIWRLAGQGPLDGSLETDRLQANERIKRFRSLGESVGSNHWKEIVGFFCEAAQNILVVRNTLAHGHIAPYGGVINNPRSRGEQRRRPAHCLHVSDQSLGLALNALYELISTILEVADARELPHENSRLLRRHSSLYKAMMNSGEIRYLNELMNQEKY
jgi:hypothetical protein